MRKLFCVIALLFALATSVNAELKGWQDPDCNPGGLHKIFIEPVKFNLNAGDNLMPPKKQQVELASWAVDESIKSLRKNRPVVKNYTDLLKDLTFIYSSLDPRNFHEVVKKSNETGYQAFIRIDIEQEFKYEHVPETTRTYTEYKDINEYDRNGKLIRTTRIPFEKTETVPAHDVKYLHTICKSWLFNTDIKDRDHKAAAEYNLYREYQGGDVMKVVENAIRACVKKMLTGK